MTDGPHGVRANQREADRIVGPATSFPTGISMAASWNPELIERVGIALGEETRALGCDILLGPCVNIVRTPLAGRNFESYAEDPYLAARIGIGYIKGVQSQKIGTSLKHYAANNQEYERFRGNSVVDERTLREIYLSQFEAIVKETQPWTVMCSYNRINGDYASQNYHLLTEILRGEWGFEGIVVSDWMANHTTIDSVKAGLDIEMPGPAKWYGKLLTEAVLNWQIEPELVDQSVRRILRMVVNSGKMDDPALLPAGSVNTPEHQALARELAEESITLLKNDNAVLPLDLTKIETIAVIGPNAADARIGGGGSSFLEPPYRISPFESLKSQAGQQVEIVYEQGCDNYEELPALKAAYVRPAKGDGQGFWGEYFNTADFTGEPHMQHLDPKLEFWWFVAGAGEQTGGNNFSARWSGKLTPPETGRFTLKLVNTGTARLYLGDKLLLDNTRDRGVSWPVSASTEVDLVAGQAYDIRLEYTRPGDDDWAQLKLMFNRVREHDDRIAQAVELAKKSDIALIFAGMPEGFESEGADRPHMDLPGPQVELIEAVASVNPKTVVILNVGSPVTMPWLDKVAAVVEAYYPGQEAGNAVTNVLLGKVNPSGKLTVTFPKRLEDTPAFNNYPGDRNVIYGEGIFVGYRHYDKRDIGPLFPFGHGLSYTTFDYGSLDVPAQAKIGNPVIVSATVKNTGKLAGKEVVQLYVGEKKPFQARPPKELKGFAKVSLQPGESETVTFTLDRRAFASYDAIRKDWIVQPGEFDILLGSSSRDIRATATVTLS
jgi:beta-glucosidase